MQKIQQNSCSSIFKQCIGLQVVSLGGICWLCHTEFYSTPYQTRVSLYQSSQWQMKLMTLPGMDIGHGGQLPGMDMVCTLDMVDRLTVDSSTMWTVVRRHSTWKLAICRFLPRLSQSHWLIKKEHARTSFKSMCNEPLEKVRHWKTSDRARVNSFQKHC